MGTGTARKWERIESYGPKFVENIVQGIARDLLSFSMGNLSGGHKEKETSLTGLPGQAARRASAESPGMKLTFSDSDVNFSERIYPIVGHVHDEVILEVDPSVTVAEVAARMEICPEWASGLVLRADGYECDFYRKD